MHHKLLQKLLTNVNRKVLTKSEIGIEWLCLCKVSVELVSEAGI